MSRRSKLVLAVWVCLEWCALAWAQSAQLYGTARDASLAALAGAHISVINQYTGVTRAAQSNHLGYYSVSFLPPGEYTIRAQAPGFATIERRKLTVFAGQVMILDFAFQVAPRNEVITVSADGTAVQDGSGSVHTTVNRNFMASLPLNGGTFQSLVALAPGVVPSNGDGQFAVNGQRDDGNYLTVDGVSANVGLSAFRTLQETAGGTVPGFNVLGTTSNLVTVDAVQEFTVQTSTYSADLGRAPGGQVQVVTRSGSNQFHGELFEHLRNDVFNANDWFANDKNDPKPPLRQNAFGGVLGGPLVRDRTFFFVSYEGLRLRQPQFVHDINVPSRLARIEAPPAIRQLLNAFPLPNGPEDPQTMVSLFSSSYSDPTSLDSGSIRVDHAFGERLNMFGRLSEARSAGVSRSDQALSHVLSDQVNTSSLTVGTTWAAKPGVANEFRVNLTRNESSHFNRLDSFGGAVPPPLSLLFPAPFASPRSSRFIFFDFADNLRFVSGKSSDHLQRQFNLADGLSLSKGAHTVKVGGDYRYLRPVFGPQDYGEQVSFHTLQEAVRGRTPVVPIFAFDNLTLAFHNLSLYAQDTWRSSSRMTLSYGLRWELNPPPSALGNQSLYTLVGVNDLANARAAPAGTPLYRTTYSNFAPRLGAAYALSRRPGGEMVIKGGIGVFYDLGTGVIAEAANSFPHLRRKTVTGLPFPLNAAASPPLPTNLDPPYSNQSLLIFDPNMRLPRTYEWNVTLQRSLGTAQSISASYVGAAGRDLLRRTLLAGSAPNFIDGSTIDLTTNTATSDYDALQVLYQRHLSRGLQALASYTWSHAIDIASDDVNNNIPLRDAPAEFNRGPSDFDVRHSLAGAFTYELPRPGISKLRPVLGGWSVQSMLLARTAAPVDITIARVLGLDSVMARPDAVSGPPLFLSDGTAPGDRRINPAAFSVPTGDRQGTLGRNALRGFSLAQVDLSLGRAFHITQGFWAQFRLDSFNVLNHPNFASPSGTLGTFDQSFVATPTFGVATAMANVPFNGVTNGLTPLFRTGGPRSLQLAIKLGF